MNAGQVCTRHRSIVNDLPSFCGPREQVVQQAGRARAPVYLGRTDVELAKVRSAFGLALHMHQPTIPAGGGDVRTATLIGHLQFMFERPDIGDNHNASVFAWCYTRMADLIRELADGGHSPRIMLDYSGNLLWGLEQMGRGDILDNLAGVTCDERYSRCVEWLGTMWGHAVVSSTPVPDIERHILAWRHHFASLFGAEALERVRGFSPPEMHLPNDPDVAYAYVEALLKCGYTWLLVQEHTVENLDGSGIRRAHLPHRLVVRNLAGQRIEIGALVKTQGSDTKLVAQMQPLAEARGLSPMELGGVSIPPCVVQIGDGENGGVMMNEFPAGYKGGVASLGREGVRILNGTEYLELVEEAGVKPGDFIPIQPLWHHRLWQRYQAGGREEFEKVTAALKREDSRFNMEGGSWTNNISWVRGYDNLLTPMQKLSARFHEATQHAGVDPNGRAYRNALLCLLCSQTSCFRYWGQGMWTDYGIELCRRGLAIVDHDLRG